MKKTLLATALAVGFASAASAQTSVTLYGRVDGGIGYEQYKTNNNPDDVASGTLGVSGKAKRTGAFSGQQNGNRWGVRGSEDLGGGLKAIFNLEGGFEISDGTLGQSNVANEDPTKNIARIFGRTAIFGLQSDSWGAIKLGRDYNFGAKYMPTVVSPHGDIYGLNSVHRTFTSGAGTVRVDNMISYETPNFSGFQFGIGYSFNYSGAQPADVSGDPDEKHTMLTTGLKYSNGPLTVAASYDQLNKRDDNPHGYTGGEKDVKSWILGASYDFDVASIHLGFGQDRNGVITARGSAAGGGINDPLAFSGRQHINDFKANNYSVGFGIPIEGAGKFMVNWQSSRLGSGALKDANRAAGGKNSQNIYTLAYRYDLSKRTNLYVSGGYATGFNFNDTKAQEVVVGLSHGF